MDYGLSEHDFWNMTLAEITRFIESRQRQIKTEHTERATFDYILAETIGRSIARIHSSSNQMPKISDVYPSLFASEEMEEKLQEKKDELSAIRFKQFVENFNSKFKEANDENE